ncbi:hypothetical protein [Anaerocolumna xylanovorans]|uniref:ArsR family transcriptional regulator n=1 Tax=Anaerocolumna xylanovorans DSM 12503 TaxID=1121345 RepID=A0A1M7Y3Q7_9FIRM|nr:hypothetical protein [Anaerocolumna xylanovorans]SHO46686.1 hypothetical protein SAMN02745217_01255 [Anaerocolumna xylanovorans DSM 12503]
MASKQSMPLKAKSCYDHLGGILGGRIFGRLLELGWFEQDKEHPREYFITQFGMEELIKLGIDPFERSK